jgi:hypothetical protein
MSAAANALASTTDLTAAAIKIRQGTQCQRALFGAITHCKHQHLDVLRLACNGWSHQAELATSVKVTKPVKLWTFVLRQPAGVFHIGDGNTILSLSSLLAVG